MKRTTWNDYATYCYSYDVANDQRSAGGVHINQIRKGPAGWQFRIKQTNGNFTSYSPVQPVDEAEGEAAFATAQQVA